MRTDINLVGCYPQVVCDGGRERSADVSTVDLESKKGEAKNGEKDKVNSAKKIKIWWLVI